MTDNEIIKALECCKSNIFLCESCTIEQQKKDDCICVMFLVKNALDLINRQKAEIERLRKAGEEAVSCFHRMESLYNIKCVELKVAKAEAYKEFTEKAIEKVEKARQKYQRLCKEQGEEIDEAMNIPFNGMINLVKEMEGEG